MATISFEDADQLFVDICPSFREVWGRSLEISEGRYPGIYIVMMRFADHLFQLWSAGELDSFPAAFELAERMIAEGDGELQESIPIGLLEDLWGHPDKPAEFRAFIEAGLKPRCRRAWDVIVEHNGYFAGYRAKVKPRHEEPSR